jgi:hypothetical protein
MQEQLPRVLSFPYSLRLLFASRPVIMGQVLGIDYRGIATHLIKQAGRKVFTLQTLPACDPEDRFGDTVGQLVMFPSTQTISQDDRRRE